LLVVVAGYRRRPKPPVEATPSTWPPPTPAAPKPPLPGDPGFSEALFLDFAQLLFVRFHTARGAATTDPSGFDPVRPYLKKRLLTAAVARKTGGPLAEVRDVVIGSAVLEKVDERAGWQSILVRFEGNYAEVDAQGASADWHVVEAWTFCRPASVRSGTPEQTTSLGCPSCGSPVELRADGSCTHCDQVVVQGNHGWQVARLVRRAATKLPPQALLGLGQPSGGDVRAGLAVRAPDLKASLRAFRRRYPEWSEERFKAHVERTFLTLQAGWSERDWARTRHFQTDPLFQKHRHWIERYLRDGITNRLEDVQVHAVKLCEVRRDPHLDLITVRVDASLIDTKLGPDGSVVAGTPGERTRFAEYWTFIRRAGCRKEPEAEERCPSCGAPVQVNAAGQCEHCEAKVTSGAFGWVLSQITQDGPWADAHKAWARRAVVAQPVAKPPEMSSFALIFGVVALGWIPVFSPVTLLLSFKALLRAIHWRLWWRLLGNLVVFLYGLGFTLFWGNLLLSDL
jgi:predicted lipid-binding transport protein (Tim44 family)